MKKPDLNCKVIEDLIPLYCEGLCSDETRALVDAHIKDCDACRKLCETTPQAALPEAETIPDEAKVFKKVNRKMKKNRLLSYGLLILIVLLLLLLARMSTAQLHRSKEDTFPSFESVFEQMHVRHLVKPIQNGDFSEITPLLSSLRNRNEDYAADHTYQDACRTAADMLNESYAAEYGNLKLKSVKTLSGYGNYGSAACYDPTFLQTSVSLIYENDRVLFLYFIRSADGSYNIMADDSADTIPGEQYTVADTNVFCRTMHYLNEPNLLSGGMFHSMLLQLGEPVKPLPKFGETETKSWTRAETIASYFSKAYQESICENLTAFAEQYPITNCMVTPMYYDEKTQQFCWDMVLRTKDDKGYAVLFTTFTRDLDGLIPQDVSKNRVDKDGCTPELADALLHLFS